LLVRILWATLADAVLATVCYRLQLNLATVSLVFLLGVVLQSTGATFISSIVASVVAAGFLDYFFIDPVLTWRIASPFDMVVLVAFITTSLVITRFASKARDEAWNAERRRRSLEQIYLCSERLLWLNPNSNVIDEALKTYVEIFDLRAACFFEGQTAEMHTSGEGSCLSVRTRAAYISGVDSDDPISGISVRCIRARGKVTAVIGFEPLRDAESTAGSLATMMIGTLERARAFTSASVAVAETKTEVFRTAVLDALAHEFKTPLAVITMAAGGLRETATRDEDRQLAEEIESEATRLSELTSRLLRKAELEGEQVQARIEPMDLLPVVSSLVDRYAHHNVDRNFSFEQNCPGGVFVAADEELLPLALGQLLENAVKYSCPHADILVSLTAEPDSVAVRVWNSGSSVPPEEREHIFERFHRGTNVQHMAPGSGLGLYIARKIARAHRGTLAIDEAHRPPIAAPDERGTPRIQPRLASPLCASSSKARRPPVAAPDERGTPRIQPRLASPLYASSSKDGVSALTRTSNAGIAFRLTLPLLKRESEHENHTDELVDCR
jgi:two-component system sensor histidine kinase KdpD